MLCLYRHYKLMHHTFPPLSSSALKKQGIQSHIELQLQPDDIHPSSEKKHQQLPHLQSSSSSTLLYLSCRTKVTTIKKYLQHKFGLNECGTLSSSLSSSSSSLPSSIELLCNGNVLLDDEDLTYIVRTYWSSSCHLSNAEVLTLTYRLGDNAEESKWVGWRLQQECNG